MRHFARIASLLLLAGFLFAFCHSEMHAHHCGEGDHQGHHDYCELVKAARLSQQAAGKLLTATHAISQVLTCSDAMANPYSSPDPDLAPGAPGRQHDRPVHLLCSSLRI